MEALKKFTQIHFIGIGGIGMSAIASSFWIAGLRSRAATSRAIP